MKWDAEARAQLRMLESLLFECQSINSANNVLPRLERIMALADELSRLDMDTLNHGLLWRLKRDAEKQDAAQAQPESSAP